MTTLVIGSRGMLGLDLCRVLTELGQDVARLDLPEFDVRDVGQVMRAVEQLRRRRVIHIAALTNVDGCERNPDAA